MWYYRRPLQDVKGGIKLQSKRGESAKSWWGRRWNETLYEFIDSGRLSRGRTYARRGQVASIDVKKGIIYGKVQGSDTDPYRVSMKMKKLNKREWERVADSLMARPSIAAKLMAGQMPEELEDIFKDAGITLFPNKLNTDCDCYDWSNPCKHIAAVYLIFSEQFDRDPFLIFQLRGMEQKELLDMIGIRLDSDSSTKDKASILTPDTSEHQPLPLDMDAFWGREGSTKIQPGMANAPSVSAALPRRLGSFPFWRSEEVFIDALDTIYDSASKAGIAAFLGDADNK